MPISITAPLAGLEVCHFVRGSGGNAGQFLGGSVSGRVSFWIAQFPRDAIFQPLRDVVLQAFALIVNLVPRVVEEIMQETFQQAVMAENLQSAHLARGSQTHSVVFLVFHKQRFLRTPSIIRTSAVSMMSGRITCSSSSWTALI